MKALILFFTTLILLFFTSHTNAQELEIIPRPNSITQKDGVFTINKETQIVVNNSNEKRHF